jgi:thiosulfate dehydrogenase (quinone) large subunit
MLARFRNLVTPLAIVAAVVLFYMENPWFAPAEGSGIRAVATVVFWLLALAVLVLMFEDRKQPGAEEIEVEEPAFSRYLFANTRAGLFWLPIRIFIGFEWVTAGWEKFTGTGWVNNDGAALLGFWTNAVKIPDAPARPPISFEWYRGFLQFLIDSHSQGWFAWVITFGEIAVGLGILFGVLTGIAAFFGATMNMSFMLAGSASVNPILFTGGIGLILAWRVAGYYGLDRYLLPMLGVPWAAKVTTARRVMSGAPTS